VWLQFFVNHQNSDGRNPMQISALLIILGSLSAGLAAWRREGRYSQSSAAQRWPWIKPSQ